MLQSPLHCFYLHTATLIVAKISRKTAHRRTIACYIDGYLLPRDKTETIMAARVTTGGRVGQ